MKDSPLASGLKALICPLCEASKLYPSEQDSMRCGSCGGHLSGAMLKTLEQIAALPDALGGHACEECAHPEMRLLPDGTFHCPACGSEVLPHIVPPLSWKVQELSEGFSLSDGRNVLPTQTTQKGGGAS